MTGALAVVPSRYRQWIAVEMDLAKGWWIEGVSAGEIGKRLDRGRASVISKANREGWGAHEKSPFRYQ